MPKGFGKKISQYRLRIQAETFTQEISIPIEWRGTARSTDAESKRVALAIWTLLQYPSVEEYQETVKQRFPEEVVGAIAGYGHLMAGQRAKARLFLGDRETAYFTTHWEPGIQLVEHDAKDCLRTFVESGRLAG